MKVPSSKFQVPSSREERCGAPFRFGTWNSELGTLPYDLLIPSSHSAFGQTDRVSGRTLG